MKDVKRFLGWGLWGCASSISIIGFYFDNIDLVKIGIVFYILLFIVLLFDELFFIVYKLNKIESLLEKRRIV